jgi:ribosomal protein S18 acetylase RimI-like enzyme
MHLLVQYLLGSGYRYLHTDTAGDNYGAQGFYERLGFQRQGYTRSYILKSGSIIALNKQR